MTVIDTKTPALPVRAWRWARTALAAFWSGFGAHASDEIAALFRRRL